MSGRPAQDEDERLQTARLMVEQLIAIREFPNPAVDFAAFHNLVTQLRDLPRYPELLPGLFFAFSDAEDYGGTWSLVHYVESFPSGIYVIALVNAAHELQKINARRWIPSLFVRVINHDEYRELMKTALSRTSAANRDAIQEMLEARVTDVHDPELKETLTERVRYVLSSMDG